MYYTTSKVHKHKSHIIQLIESQLSEKSLREFILDGLMAEIMFLRSLHLCFIDCFW